MDVLVTGAHGTVGTAITDHLASWGRETDAYDARESYSFTLLDRAEPDDDHPHASATLPEGVETVVADVGDRDALGPAFEGQDAVVHLAGYPTTDGTWDEVRENNVVGTHNVFEAARDAGVETVVFASSNHAVGMYEVDRAPDIYYGTDLTVDHTAPVRPDSEYGASKAAGEDFGRLFAERHGLAVYPLRICSVRRPEYDHPYGDAERGVDDGRWDRGSDDYEELVARMKAMWQSRRDHAHMVDCCLSTGQVDDVTFEICYGVSDNERRWFDVDHARDAVGYDPIDDGEEWDGPPATN